MQSTSSDDTHSHGVHISSSPWHSGYTLRCVLCDQVNDERHTSTYCTSCGGVLRVHYDEPRPGLQFPLRSWTPDPLKNHPSALKHLPRLSERYGVDLWAKLEFEHPTGCFKDRGSTIEVQKAIELGRDAICLASTGNMAASVAAYACHFQIPCFVFVPEKTSEAKLAQATIFNATIVRIQGDFAKCEELCKEFAKSGNYYLAGDYVFREEGQKDFAYELVEQGGADVDAIFIPVGCGTNFGAIHKGFLELRKAGLIDRIPQLVAVQPIDSSPVVEGIFKRKKIVKDMVSTMASSVAAANPIDFHKVLQGIDDTQGTAYTVTEDQILDSLQEMAHLEGHFTEPACALPLASVKENLRDWRGKKVLLVLTGTGLKDTQAVAKHSLTPPLIEPTIEAVQSYIASGFPELQKKAWGKARGTILANLKMDAAHDALFANYVQNIERRGKTLRQHEVEALQSLVLQEKTDVKRPLQIMDYKVIMRKEGLVDCSVQLRLNGRDVLSRAKGVGPIDAVIGAIRQETDSVCKVTVRNHEVEILSPDTDSLVVMTLTLEHEGRQVRSKGVSPDTLEAAIHAFEKGFAAFMAG